MGPARGHEDRDAHEDAPIGPNYAAVADAGGPRHMGGRMLCDQGWQLLMDDRVEVLHPILPPVTADPVTH